MAKSIRKRTRKRVARGTIQTSRTTRRDGESEETTEASKEISEAVEGEPGYVGITGGLTKNLGNFNSAKISATVSLPFTDSGDDSVREAYTRASALVDEFLDAEYKKAVGEEGEAGDE
jgi:hypothetical protein